MFDTNFTFDPSRSPSLSSTTTGTSASTRHSSRSVSPCTSTFPSPPFTTTRYSVADLTSHFATHRLRRDAQICYDSCASYANTEDDDEAWAIPSSEQLEAGPMLERARTFPTRPHSPSRRAQRQLNTRMLCTSSHRAAIEALVGRMVEKGDMCDVAPVGSTSPSHANVGEEDEGYDSSDTANAGPTPASRRASLAQVGGGGKARSPRSAEFAKGATGACVRKEIRFRKGSSRRIRALEKA